VGEIQKEVVVACFKTMYYYISHEGAEENHEKSQTGLSVTNLETGRVHSECGLKGKVVLVLN
jgi:hypothetical protein